jgi:predicted MFS family arabinose efflux permease
MGLSYPFFNVYFQEELGAATATIGAIFFLSQIIGLPCTISAPAIVRRFGPLLTLIPLRALSAFALAGLGVWLNLPIVVALFFFIAAIESLTTPTEMAFAANTPSAYLGRMQSLRVTGFQCLSALGSIWAGTLIVQHGYFAAFGLAGVALLASTFVFFIAFGYHSKEEAHAP